jgi:hypothetical protein
VKSCPVQTPAVVPNVPKIAAEVEEKVAVISLEMSWIQWARLSLS